MIKEFGTLFFVLLALLVGWSFYEKSTWPIDYTAFAPEAVDIQPLDSSFEQHIIPKYFSDALVINDTVNLRTPEDIAVDNNGTMYSGLDNGVIAKIFSEGEILHLIKLNQTGKILGIILNKAQTTLYFATELQGLMKLDLPTNTPSVLLKDFKGKSLVLNNLCIDEENGILYLTRTGPISMKFANKQIFAKHRKGQIIAFNLQTGEATVIFDKIAFPNGIVYEASTQSVIFSQLNLHRLIRLFVDGPRKGQHEILKDNLFGFADNLKLNEKGELLIAFPSTRDAFLDFLNGSPAIRKILMYLPERLIYSLAKKRAGGIKIDTKTGQIIEYLLGGPTKIYMVTTILEKNGKTYFTSLKSPTILVLNNTSKPKAGLTGNNPSSDL